MGEKFRNILIIDNHPLLVPVFSRILQEVKSIRSDWVFKIRIARDCDEAIILLERMDNNSEDLHLVLLEIDIPASANRKYFSGEDIALAIRTRFGNARIIINTAFKNNYRISTVLKRVNPEGLIIRSDLTEEILRTAIRAVLENNVFYSNGILKHFHRRIDPGVALDDLDIQILYELSQGSKMKEISDIIPYSLGAVEKRKQRIKALFQMEDANDRQLLDQARKYGFI